LTIVIETRTNPSSKHSLRRVFTNKKITIFAFATIPLAVLIFYGIEDKTAWFFGHDYINDYRYRIDGVVHRIGVMVGHFALVVTLSVISLLIAWITYEFVKSSNILKSKREEPWQV
jgi:hypothetical protein